MQRKGSVTRLATPIKALAQRFAFLLLVAVSFALMMLGKADLVVLDRIRGAATDAVTPVLNVLSRPIDSAATLIDHIHDLSEIKAENDRLKQENDRLLQWQHVARRLDAENQELRKLLHFVPGKAISYISARVVADTGGAFVRSVLIAAGSRDGVKKGQAVVTGDGLVGRIASVGRRSARVLLLTDFNSRIPIILENSREMAVLAGDNSDQPLLIHLDGPNQVTPGERIMTSGHAEAFPPGLPIGVVSSVDKNGIRVQPYVSESRLQYVRVVDFGDDGILNTDGPAPPKGP